MIKKKKFAKRALYEDFETFVIHDVALEALKILMDSSRTAHINSDSFVQVATFQPDEISIKVPPKYINFSDVFS